MADWSLPTNASLYTDYTAQNDARMDDLAVGLDPAVVTATNIPANTIRWTSASARWQKWNGSAWSDLSTLYQINISGNAGTATTLATARTINGVSFNGSANITVTANTTNAVTFNNGGAGAVSGTTFNGSAAQTISYNSVGAPSTTGTNASGTWGISVSGSAATLTTARNINGVAFNGSADVVVEPFIEDDETTNAARYLVFVDSTTSGYQRLNEDSALNYNPSTNTLTVGTVSGALSGNATTATTLQTARTINGVSFNGSANITVTAVNPSTLTFSTTGNGAASGSYDGSSAQTISYNTVGAPSTTGTGASGTWAISISGNAATATTAAACSGNSATATTASAVTNGVYTTGDQTIGGNKTFSGNTTLSGKQLIQKTTAVTVGSAGGSDQWELSNNSSGACVMSFHRNSVYAINMGLDTDNVFRLGGWSNGTNTFRWQSDTSGNFTAQGNVTAYSDIRLKTNLTKISNALAKVNQLNGYTYTRIDSGERQTGVVAQEVQAVLPEAVIDGGEHLAVAYGNMVGLLIEAVKELTARVEKLEGR